MTLTYLRKIHIFGVLSRACFEMSGKSWRLDEDEEEEEEESKNGEEFESGRYSNGNDNLSKRLKLSEYFHHRQRPSSDAVNIERFTDADYSDTINNNNNGNDETTDKKPVDEDNNNNNNNDTNATMASGKMIGSRIYFQDIYDDFKKGDLNEIRKQQPPYVAKMSDSELEKIIAHELHRINQKEKILKDEYFLFVNIVAGLSHTALSELTLSPSGKGVSGGVGSVVYGRGRASTAPTNISPLGGPGGVLFSPRASREGTGTTSTPLGRGRSGAPTSFSGPRRDRTSSDINNNNNNNTSPDEEEDPSESERLAREEAERRRSFNSNFIDSLMKDTATGVATNNNNTRVGDANIRELLKDPEWRSRAEDWISRNRMYENLPWMERSDVLGISDMSPIIFGPMTSVHSLIQIRGGEAFEDITIDDLVKDDKVRPVYAAAVSSQIKVSRTSSTRQHLQVDYERAMKELNAAIDQIVNGFKVDYNSVDPAKKFNLITSGDVYGEMYPRYKSSTSIPFAYNSSGGSGFMYPKTRNY
jgi:hypothetical protein